MSLSNRTTRLPTLRPDVAFHRGPDADDGSPTYVLHDPLHNTFEQLSWPQAEIIRQLRRPIDVESLQVRLAKTSTVRVSDEDVAALCGDLVRKGLTQAPPPAPATKPATDLSTLFRRFTFARIPIMNPDDLLDKTVAIVRPLGSVAAMWLYAAAAVVGLLLLIQHWNAYLATFPYFFSISGAATFAITLTLIKAIHEFAHAYTAKALGNRVPSMGIALIFLFPVAYTDVTDSWRMRSRRKRLRIAAAGVLAELVIAAFALIVWSFSTSGMLQSICFVVSSVTLASTLLVNVNPLMRFDGYYVLSDLLGIDNLQSRSFATMRWLIRRGTIGLNVPHPESAGPSRRTATLCIYAAAAWAYRLSLYAGIALMLYHWVAKVVGIVLMSLAVYTFLLRPIVVELATIWRLRKTFRWNWRTPIIATGVAAVIGWAAIPLPRRHAAPAITTAPVQQVLYAPIAGTIREMNVQPGDEVHAGQTLVIIDPPRIAHERLLAELEIERVALEMATIRQGPRNRAMLRQKSDELARAKAHAASIEAAIEAGSVVAEANGTIVEWDPSIRPGMPIARRQPIGRILGPDQVRIVAYVPDEWIGELCVGDAVRFASNARPTPLSGTVQFIDPLRVEHLPARGLASAAGGPIAATESPDGHLIPVGAVFSVQITLDSPAPDIRIGQTGRAWFRGQPRSLMADWTRRAVGAIWRESGF